MASLAYRIAIDCPRFKTDVVDIAEFPQLSMQYNVMGVPFTVVNGRYGVRGYVTDRGYFDQVIEVALRSFAAAEEEPTAREKAIEEERRTSERLRSLGLASASALEEEGHPPAQQGWPG